MTTITGSTRLFGIIADPISQVRTPEVLNAYFAAHGIDAVMVPMHVSADGLPAAMQAFRQMKNLGGIIVTVPHKTEVAALCDVLGPAGRAIGSINTIRRLPDGRLEGDMFDGAGFVSGLVAQGHDPRGRRVLLLGAGGAAGAIAFALAQGGVAHLAVANRTASKAQDVLDRVQPSFPGVDFALGSADAAGYDIIVNATSLGMKEGDPLPLDASTLQPGQLVAEIIMKPEMTALLHTAQSAGCRIHLGKHMLDEQVRQMVSYFGY